MNDKMKEQIQNEEALKALQFAQALVNTPSNFTKLERMELWQKQEGRDDETGENE